MPMNLDPNAQGRGIDAGQSYDYTYPNKLDLKPYSETHKKLLTEVFNRAQESSNEMSKRYPSWKKVDKTLTAYIKPDEAEKIVKDNDDRKPVSIVVPYSYAALETILTYFVSAFLESPIFRYEGSSPEDIMGAILMEKVIENHTQNFKVALNLHTMFRDSFSYGIGVVAPSWDKKWGSKTVIAQDGFMSQVFGRFLSTGIKKVSEETILYEGNCLKNVDPYKYLPDPNVAIHDTQKGEYVGWIESTNYMKLLELERNDPTIFNVKYLKGVGSTGGQSQFNKSKTDSGRSEKFGLTTTSMSNTTTPIDVVWMYITIIPKDWKLSSLDYPEKWLFGLAADKIIICARPLDLNHNMYPVAVSAPDFDGYSATPISRMEILYGLQETLDWMFNSHVSNVRKAINDMLIVDPSLVNMKDLEDPKPGKLVRIRRSAWGRGVDNAVKQLAVQDITKNNIVDAGYIVDLIQRVSSATDSLSGMVRQGGERVTAAESNSTRSSALSRLTKAARIASIQAMFDIGYMFASHTQQLMEKDTYVKTAGEWQQILQEEYGSAQRVKVTPYDLLIDYDLIIKDGSVNSGEYSEGWVEVFRIMSQQPMLFQNFDMVKIFKHVARMMGAKDINSFILQHGQVPMVDVKAATQGVIDQQVQQGNLAPMGGM